MGPGTLVRLTSDPGRSGITTGKSRIRGNRLFWQVSFRDGPQYISEKQLEIVGTEVEDALDLFRDGKLGRARDLRGVITHIRLSGRLADLIYSMETTNTDFYPYQFKPVLNFLESHSNGLLIADEVGLGKTIEAGLIWTELRSRYDTRRLMVLCPAMLREKWKLELQRRFGIKADIVDANEVMQIFGEYHAGHINEYAIISSMQGLRPNRGWDDNESINSASSKLARFLNERAHDEPLLDLLIVDEAHYLRNPESMTAKLGRLLRDVAEHVVLLSATPVHLRSLDLYHLLNLVDEDSFNQIHVFDDILEANAPLLKARDSVLRGNIDLDDFLSHLSEAKNYHLFKNNRQLQAIIDKPPTQEDINDNAYRSQLAHRLEGINLLGRAVTRTRKREVTEWRVIREAVAEEVEMTPLEEAFYDNVTDIVREYCLERNAHEGFLLVTPQRQISSSMPAALREWQKKKIIFDQMYEDIGDEDENGYEVGPLVQKLLENVKEMGNLEELWENDSKYKRFSSEIKRYLQSHPKEKIIVFAYFRPTIYYLNERLAKEGFDSIVLVGGAKADKYEIMESFRNPKGPNILLASEVASEGIDLQFSRVVVNYDLPWNPMKVEQRIGRIDRLGQKSPKIAIWNLFYNNTIDARIYERLYLRLGIFEHALGGLEAVLGDEIKKLTYDLLSGKLTKKQEEERISQATQALSNLRDEEERLEKNANNLIAHGDYILHQVSAARELGRWVTGEDLWIYIRDFFYGTYPGCDFRQLEPDKLIFDIRLSDEARFDFDRFLFSRKLTARTRLSSSSHKAVRCQFKNQVPQKASSAFEDINQFHPLVHFVSENIKKNLEESKQVYFPAVSLRLNSKAIPTLKPADYVFHVERWTVRGVRDIERMVYFARKAVSGSHFLHSATAELLVTTAARSGQDWLSAANETDHSTITLLLDECMAEAEEKYSEYITMIVNENNDRADLQEQTLKLHLERQKVKLQEVMDSHKAKGHLNMIPPTLGKISKMEARVNDKLRDISGRRELQHHAKEVCLGILRVE